MFLSVFYFKNNKRNKNPTPTLKQSILLSELIVSYVILPLGFVHYLLPFGREKVKYSRKE